MEDRGPREDPAVAGPQPVVLALAEEHHAPLFDGGDDVVEDIARQELAEVIVAVPEHERGVDDAEPVVPDLEVVHGLDEEVLGAGDDVLELHRDGLPELGGVEDLHFDVAVGELVHPLGEEVDGNALVRCRGLQVAGPERRGRGGRCRGERARHQGRGQRHGHNRA